MMHISAMKHISAPNFCTGLFSSRKSRLLLEFFISFYLFIYFVGGCVCVSFFEHKQVKEID